MSASNLTDPSSRSALAVRRRAWPMLSLPLREARPRYPSSPPVVSRNGEGRLDSTNGAKSGQVGRRWSKANARAPSPSSRRTGKLVPGARTGPWKSAAGHPAAPGAAEQRGERGPRGAATRHGAQRLTEYHGAVERAGPGDAVPPPEQSHLVGHHQRVERRIGA